MPDRECSEIAPNDIWSMMQAIPAHDRDDYKASDVRSVWRFFRDSGIGIGSLKTHKIGKRRFACPEDVDAYVQFGKQEGAQ